MKTYLCTASLLLLLACQSKTGNDGMTSDSTQADTLLQMSADNDELSPDEESVSSSSSSVNREMLTKAGTVVYPDTATDESMGERAIMEKVTLLSTTGIRYPVGEDLCNQYYWYEVRFPDDQSSGWVYGKDVMLIYADDNAYVGDIEYRGKSYQIFYAYDTGIGPSDSNGLTGCNSYKILYFQDSENKIQFITNSVPVSPSGLIESFDNWLSLISSEGGDASVVAVESIGDEILFNVNISYQEGGERVIIHVTQQDGIFTAVSAESVSEE